MVRSPQTENTDHSRQLRTGGGKLNCRGTDTEDQMKEKWS